MNFAYYKFEALPEDLKERNKIRSNSRLDCTEFYDLVGYKGLTNFVNHKGQLFFFKTPVREFVQANPKRIAEIALTSNSINLTSIYLENPNFPQYGYGYPNANKYLRNGKENPMFQFRNDLFLFIIDSNYSILEILVVFEGRNLVNTYYQCLVQGELDQFINRFRLNAVSFYDYSKVNL